MDVMLKDPALAPDGRRKIAFAGRRMPVLEAVRAEFERTRPLRGLRIAACLHVTTETANLCRALAAGGAELALCASNPLSTKDDVAAAIHEDLGAQVYAVHGTSLDGFQEQIRRALEIGPQLVLDDGADLTSTVHTDHPGLLDGVLGGTEVTSAGVQRLRNMEREGVLRWPVLSLNDALTKHLFDNRYGTGQNTLDGILRATNLLLAGSVLVVAGYGWCGRGVAMRARGMGARVIVVEVDPIKALEAVMDGLQVLPMAEAAAVGDVFVTVTGNRGVITLDHLKAMKPGAIVCNSGHFDLEIDLAALGAAAVAATPLRPGAVEYTLEDGKGVVVLAEGRLVGQACAEASPAEVMDLTFSTQALAVAYLATEGRGLPAGVHRVPAAIEEQVARQKLTALGVRCDQLRDDQRDYLRSWRAGTGA
ncbi:MAG TPA: adenosylhomocysteinase [Actinomycetota bacterium]|jgi:adenosylhomocysteinase|nr:adenosylhomocysteinase [Actinomycetota bacterium]